MNYKEFRRWLTKQGCTFETHQGGSGHITVRLGAKFSQLPAHGSKHDLRKGLVEKIKKDLELK